MEVEISLSQIYNSYVISRPNTCVDGDGTVPAESAKADGLKAEARVGVPGEHRGILCERHLFRILKHWLKAGDPDPYYNPLNDYVILPTAFEMEQHKENDQEVASLKGEWEMISHDQDECNHKISLCAISVSHEGPNQSCSDALAGILVHSGNNCESMFNSTG